MRDSMIIYRSFYDAIKELKKENQAEVWSAIFEYSLNFKEIPLKGISKTVFTLIKPQLDANIKKYKNGVKPKKTDKPDGSEKEAKDKQNESESEANVNDNVNENKNDNDNDNSNAADIEVSVSIPDLNPALGSNNEINNKPFSNEAKKSTQWCETTAMHQKIKVESIPAILDAFDIHLITRLKQHPTYKEYIEHFGNWIRSQDLSEHLIYKKSGTNQLLKASPYD